MKTLPLKSHIFNLSGPGNAPINPSFFTPTIIISKLKKHPPTKPPVKVSISKLATTPKFHKHLASTNAETISNNGLSRNLILGSVSVGIMVFLMGLDDEQNRALALGPGGPLMEDFWDNMRRYGLYALTVSTGVLYAVFEPIVELLKNPVSAILILTIIGGGLFIVSQVVSAMIGVSEFNYDYSY